jgi:hypothetical protein
MLDGMAAGDVEAEPRVKLEITVSRSEARMLRIAAAERAGHLGGRPSVSRLVGTMIADHWHRLGGPPPPLLPEPPPSGIRRGCAA